MSYIFLFYTYTTTPEATFKVQPQNEEVLMYTFVKAILYTLLVLEII